MIIINDTNVQDDTVIHERTSGKRSLLFFRKLLVYKKNNIYKVNLNP